MPAVWKDAKDERAAAEGRVCHHLIEILKWIDPYWHIPVVRNGKYVRGADGRGEWRLKKAINFKLIKFNMSPPDYVVLDKDGGRVVCERCGCEINEKRMG